MKTSSEIKTEIYGIIKQSGLMESMTGVLRKTKRPKDSRSEDVVISVIANQNGKEQMAIVVVNAYIQDEERDGQMEESPRVGEVAKMMEQLLDVVKYGRVRITLEKQEVFELDTDEHYISNRLLYRFRQ